MDDVDADIYVLQICCTRWNDMCLSYKLNVSSVFLGIPSTESSLVLIIFRVASGLSRAFKKSIASSSPAFFGLTFLSRLRH